MTDCIFCKIVKGEIPCHKIFEDEYTFAFLDISPVSIGHTLIIPRKHSENVFDIPAQDLERVIVVAKKLAIHYKPLLHASGFNTVNASGKDAQQSVFHYHMHLVPRYPADGIDLWFHGNSDAKPSSELANKLRIHN